MNTSDTIAALCTALGGAISIIRISGKDSLEIGNSVWKGKDKLSCSISRVMNFGHCVNDANSEKVGDPSLAVYMQGPNTYTGEDVVEIHCHGGSFISREILGNILSKGARPAEPGEFTFRAFMNGKLDLTQAESVSDIINAQSDMALHLAERQMYGSLGEKIRGIRNELFSVLSECESHLDFGEEDLNWQPVNLLVDKVENCIESLKKLLDSSREGVILRNGIRVVLAGRPNAGKSSLLNLILGFNRAIVTQIPGTTRDTLEELANIRNIPVKLIDTAGIREADDIIEAVGVEKSFESLKRAQIIIWIMDASGDVEEEYKTFKEHVSGKNNVIPLWNKCDIAQNKKLPESENYSEMKSLNVSVVENKGIEALFDEIENLVWGEKHTDEPEMAVSSRHAVLLQNAIDAQIGIDVNLEAEEWELAAVQLRSAIFALGTVTGEDADPDVLDDIFSRFCIGK